MCVTLASAAVMVSCGDKPVDPVIEVTGIELDENVLSLQMGETEVGVQLYLRPADGAFDMNVRKAESVSLLQRQEEIFRALEKFSGETFQPLIRVHESVETKEGFICARTTFKTVLYDAPSDDGYIPLPTAPDCKFS